MWVHGALSTTGKILKRAGFEKGCSPGALKNALGITDSKTAFVKKFAFWFFVQFPDRLANMTEERRNKILGKMDEERRKHVLAKIEMIGGSRGGEN
jgi:hypothetical protein